ncbi:DUF5302 domain-containing protein [Hoyosella subflava]|uniref:DUF5302 domain-containing protein n=1 Tax=Hoyosella subflava TaxID=639313 RepID=UPI0013050B21|nr:DUF5302 domain-containing protein [Hoyosella subflava]
MSEHHQVPDEQKRQFKEALAQKNAHDHDPHNNHAHGQGKAHDAHGAEGNRKMFRRKSG